MKGDTIHSFNIKIIVSSNIIQSNIPFNTYLTRFISNIAHQFNTNCTILYQIILCINIAE